MTKEEMASHIDALCVEHDIKVENYSSQGRAFRKDRMIQIRPVRSEVTYAVGLHEIGHVVGPWQSMPSLYCEAGAWVWATQNAQEWTPTMHVTMIQALTSYLEWALHRQHRSHARPRIPEANHKFWQLVEKGKTEACEDLGFLVRRGKYIRI